MNTVVPRTGPLAVVSFVFAIPADVCPPFVDAPVAIIHRHAARAETRRASPGALAFSGAHCAHDRLPCPCP